MTDTRLVLVGAGAVAVLALIGYNLAKKAGQTIAANGNLVNPLSQENIVYRGANAVANAVLTGGSSNVDSLGTWYHRLVAPGYHEAQVGGPVYIDATAIALRRADPTLPVVW